MKDKKQISSKKLILIISTILLALVAVAGLAMAFLLNYNGFSPAKVQVLDDGENVYIMTTVNDSYEGYRFKFTTNENEIIIDSTTNMISSELIIEKGAIIGQTYNVSTCYLGKNKGNNSEYSDGILWLCSKYLATPSITYNEVKDSLQWSEIENAEYYRIYFDGDNEYIETSKLFLDLQTIEGGDYTFTVMAFSDKAGYKTSASSNSFIKKVVHYLNGFLEISFDPTTKVVTATSDEVYEKIQIILDSTNYEINLFDLKKLENGNFEYKIDINTIYKDETTIGIAPLDKDEYDIFRGDPKYFVITM